jgi:hypothetical protein
MTDTTEPAPHEEHGRHEAPPVKSGGPWKALFIIIAVILLLGIIFLLLWLFVFSKGGGGTPTNTPTQTATTTPTQTVTPPPLAACTRDQIVATLGDPEGAAGSTTVPIVIGNTGADACSMNGYPVVFFIWEDGSTTGAASTDDTSVPATEQLIGPGNEAGKVMMTITEAANECDAPVTTLGFRVTFPGMSDSIDIDNTSYMACGDDTISLIKVGPVGPGGSG